MTAGAEPQFCIRPFARNDAAAVLELMRGLAAFEDYLEDFHVTEDDLLEHTLGPRQDVFVLVADAGTRGIIGMSVHYFVPYTYHLRPDCILKELFVRPDMRGAGAGLALMNAVRAEALKSGGRRVKWLVLKGNEPARGFYRAWGGEHDTKWENWTLELEPSNP